MFERFTARARALAEGAQLEAQSAGASSVRSEHLLAAVLTGPPSRAQAVLDGLGVDQLALLRAARAVPDGADASTASSTPPPVDDAAALAALGIDLEQVRRRVDDSFGRGALERTRASRRGGTGRRPRWDRSAKQVLELSLRETLALEHSRIGTEHVLLGLLHPGTGAGQRVLAAAGVELRAARLVVADLLRDREAG